MVNVGETWTRKAPSNDGWDTVEICGVQETAKEHPVEFVVRPVGGLATVSVTEADLRSVFVLSSAAPDTPEVVIGLDSLEGWA